MQSPLDISAFQPSSLSHLVGQRKIIEQVTVGLDAAQQDSRKFDHSLLAGPPGLGKSALAQVIANEMASGFHEVLGQAVNSLAELNALLLTAQNRDIVFIDEAHEMSKTFQTALYLALDKQRIFVRNNGGSPLGLAIADFTLLLATTDEYCLLQPLRDRMKLVLRYEFYTDEELAQVVRHRCKALGWTIDEAVLPQIAQRSRGTPRLALRLLQSCHRVCRSVGQSSIGVDQLHRACELEEIDDEGLGPMEQQYLRLLASGPNRLNVLASRLSLPTRTVSDVVESFLIRAGLVTKSKDGSRELTPAGRKHLSKQCP